MKKRYCYFKIFWMLFIGCCFVIIDYAVSDASCLGDSDGDGVVSDGEVKSAVNQFLGLEPVQECCDEYYDSVVGINDLQRIIDRHINGCNAKDWYEEDNTLETANILIKKDTIGYVPGYEPSQSHNFHTKDDVDWIKFYASENAGTYQIQVEEVGIDCDPVIEIYDEKKILAEKVFNDRGEGEDDFADLKSPLDGVYYVKICHSTPSEYKVGGHNNYKVTLSINSGAAPGMIYGKVIPAVSGVVKTEAGGAALISSDGLYFMYHNAGSFHLWVEATGYTFQRDIRIGEAETLRYDIKLQPVK